MNIPNNRRSQKTKETFRNALLTLLEQNITIEKISVSKLCAVAGLNRTTFYSHYSVINDILVEIREDALEKLSTYVGNIQYIEYESLGVLLNYIKANDKIFRVLFVNATDEEFENRFINTGVFALSKESNRIWNKRYVKYFNTYLLNGTRYLLKKWIKNNYDISVKDLKQMIIILNLSNLEAMPNINLSCTLPKK